MQQFGHTVEIKNLYAIQISWNQLWKNDILQTNNCDTSSSVVMTEFLNILTFKIFQIFFRVRNQSQISYFRNLSLETIDFNEVLSGRKILEFLHCFVVPGFENDRIDLLPCWIRSSK